MRLKILLLITALAVFLFFKFQNFLKLEGLHFSKSGLSLEKFELNLGIIDLKLFNLAFNLKSLKVLSGNLDIKVPQTKGVYYLNGITAKDLANYIDLGLKIASYIPFEVGVKSFYISVYPADLYVNLYRFSKVENQLNLNFGELFVGKNKINFSDVSLTLFKNYLLLGGEISYSDYRFYLNADGNLKSGLRVFLNSKGLGNYLATLKFKKGLLLNLSGSYKNVNLKGNFSYNFTNLSGNLKATYGEFLSYSGKLLYSGLEGFLLSKGKISLCGRDFYYSYLYGKNLESLLLQSLKPKIYILTYNGKGFGYINNGGFKLKGGILTLKEVSLNNICGLSIEKLTLKGDFNKNFSVSGGFEKFEYSKGVKVALNGESFELIKEPFGISLNLKKSVEGNVFANRAVFKENLKGEIFVNEKPLEFSIGSKLNFLENKLIADIGNLNYADLIGVKNVKLSAKYGKSFVEGFFGKSWKGKLLVGEKYFADLKGKILLKGEERDFTLKAKGNKRSGKFNLKLSDYSLSLNYNSKGGIYRGLFSLKVPYLTTNGDFEFKNSKLSLRTFSSLDADGLSTLITTFGKLDLKTKSVEISALPFCLNLYDIKLTCFDSLYLNRKGSNLLFKTETEKGFPVYLKTYAFLKGENLKLKGDLELQREFLNYLLLSVGSYIESPEGLKLSFSYSGEVSKFLEDFSLTYAQSFDIASQYLYKPVSLYLSANYLNGNFDLLLGLAQRNTGNPYGTAELNLNLLKKEYKLSFDFSDLPVGVSKSGLFSSYLNLYLRGYGDLKRKFLNATVGVGGFVNLYSYKFPKKEGSSGGSLPIKLNVKLSTLEPIFIRFPNGEVLLTFAGNVKDKKKHLRIFINYGKLNLLGKEFVISNGEVRIENEKTYLDLNLTHRAEDRTIYLHIYGYLPWENLKFDIYSIPPAPRDELIAYLVSGAGKEGATQALGNFPLAGLLTKGAYAGISQLLGILTSNFIGGVKVNFSPSFDPKTGLTFGVTIEKDFSDFASLGYRWMPSEDPKSTYLWGSLRFLYNSFFRFTRYSDGSSALTVRFLKDFGKPF